MGGVFSAKRPAGPPQFSPSVEGADDEQGHSRERFRRRDQDEEKLKTQVRALVMAFAGAGTRA